MESENANIAGEEKSDARNENGKENIASKDNGDVVESKDSIKVVKQTVDTLESQELSNHCKNSEREDKKEDRAVLETSTDEIKKLSQDNSSEKISMETIDQLPPGVKWVPKDDASEKISKESFDKLPPEVANADAPFPKLKIATMSRGTSTTVVKVDVKGASQDLRITAIPLDDSSKIVKIESDRALNGVDDSESKDNSDIQFLPADMSAKQRVELLKENLETAIQAKENIQDELMEEINSLSKEYVKEAKKHVKKYNERLKALVGENTKLTNSLRKFLLGKILYIPKVSWQKMIAERAVTRPAKWSSSSWSKTPVQQIKPIVMSKNPTVTLLDLAKRAYSHIPGHEQRKTEAVVAKIDQSKVEKQLKENVKMIVEFFPYLTFDDAEVCLKSNDGNIGKVHNMLAEFRDQFEVFKAIDKMKAKLESEADEKKLEELSPPEYTKASSSMTKKMPPCVAGKIVDFTEDCSVITVQLLRDRNRIPLKSGVKRQFVITKFLNHTWYFTDEEKFEKGLKEQRLNIQYKVDEATGDMIPLKLYPVVRYAEYKFNWNSRSRKLNSVTHTDDGPVLFEATEVETHIYDEEPMHIYTQIIDESSVNILMILLTDTRDNISVESFNLTHTNKTIEDFKTEFNVDMSGKKLNYRIIVKDGDVQAILAPTKKPGDCKRMKFMEQKIPCVGALISTDSKIGRLKSIPTGLIVTNNSAGVEKKELKYKKRPGPETWGRHISDLSGFVDVDVLIHEEELLPEPRKEAWNVCEFQLADQGEKDLLQALKTLYVSVNDCELFEAKVEDLVLFLKNAPKNDDSFKVAQEKLTEIRKLEKSDEVQKMNLPEKHKGNLRSFVRELRLMKLGN